MIKLIGISGKICSGKTTVSEALIERYGYKRVVLAEPLKAIGKWFIEYSMDDSKSELELDHILYELMSNEEDMMPTTLAKVIAVKEILYNEVFPQFKNADWSQEKNNDIRLLYQLIGETLRQHFGDDIWVKAMIQRIRMDQILHNITYFICDDVRQKSEYNLMKESGFKIVRLLISKDTQMERVHRLYGKVDPKRFEHISEVDLDDVTSFDLVVDSNTPIEDVISEIVEFIETN